MGSRQTSAHFTSRAAADGGAAAVQGVILTLMTVSVVNDNKASPAKELLSAFHVWKEAELSKQGPISTSQENSLDDDVDLGGKKATRSEGGR